MEKREKLKTNIKIRDRTEADDNFIRQTYIQDVVGYMARENILLQLKSTTAVICYSIFLAGASFMWKSRSVTGIIAMGAATTYFTLFLGKVKALTDYYIHESLSTDLGDIEEHYKLPNRFLVAEVDGDVAGIAAIVIQNDENVGEIQRMAVKHEFRQSGVATALMAALLEYAKSSGLIKVKLGTSAVQKPAIRLYSRLGFRIVSQATIGVNGKFYSSRDHKPLFFTPGLDLVFLEKALASKEATDQQDHLPNRSKVKIRAREFKDDDFIIKTFINDIVGYTTRENIGQHLRSPLAYLCYATFLFGAVLCSQSWRQFTHSKATGICGLALMAVPAIIMIWLIRRLRGLTDAYIQESLNSDLADIGHFYQQPNRFFLAEVDGQIAGMVAIESNRKEGTGEVKRMAVLKDYRRYGVATTLMRALMDHGKSVGLTKIKLGTSAVQKPAIRMYESLGFRVVSHSTIGLDHKFYSEQDRKPLFFIHGLQLVSLERTLEDWPSK